MRFRPRNDAELEAQAEIKRTEEPRPSLSAIRQIERKILGRDWGKPRRKMTGWPR